MEEKEALKIRIEQETSKTVAKLSDYSLPDEDFTKSLLDLCTLNKLSEAVDAKY